MPRSPSTSPPATRRSSPVRAPARVLPWSPTWTSTPALPDAHLLVGAERSPACEPALGTDRRCGRSGVPAGQNGETIGRALRRSGPEVEVPLREELTRDLHERELTRRGP